MKERIRILHIIKSLGRGGAEMLLPETLKLHDQSRFDFHYIYFLPWKDQMAEAIMRHGGKVTCIPANNNLQLLGRVNKVADYIRKNNISLIHAHLPWAGVAARLAGKLTGVPVVYTEHNKQERYHFATRSINLMTMNWLTRIIAVSDDVEKSIRKHKPRLKASLQTIVNGVNVDHFRPAGREAGVEVRTRFGIPPNAPTIGTVAVFRFQKRLDLWLKIANEIRRTIPETHFIIVGDGPLKSKLEEECASLGLQEVVHFAGLQSEIRPFLAAFDLYMMSSVFEGLPIALLEAMASGCAVISTDAGGIREVIRDGVDGLLCPVDQAEYLISFAVELMANADRRRTLGEAARNRVVEEFSMNKMVVDLELMYDEILDRRAGATEE